MQYACALAICTLLLERQTAMKAPGMRAHEPWIERSRRLEMLLQRRRRQRATEVGAGL